MKARILLLNIFFLSGMVKLSAQSPMQNFKKYAGDWTADIIMWMGANEPPMKDEVQVHIEMKMNDLFLASQYKGTVMATPYEGLGILGYDLQRNLYVNSFIDNMNSGIQYTEGTSGDNGKTIELHGKVFDGNSQQEVPLREVVTFADDNHEKIEFFATTNGTETKTMEIDLVRR